jgi:hypothetical protein
MLELRLIALREYCISLEEAALLEKHPKLSTHFSRNTVPCSFGEKVAMQKKNSFNTCKSAKT